MKGRAPAGAEVSLFVDLVARVYPGDVIETRSGRRYGVTSVRVQERGKRAGRQHLRAIVLPEAFPALFGGRVHRIRWARAAKGSGAAGVERRA